jgi:hypothetical protein
LLAWSKEHADEIAWGTGAQSGSFNVKFTKVNTGSVFTVESTGVLVLNFAWLREPEASAECAKRLGSALREAGWGEIPSDFMQKYVKLQLPMWAPRLEEFTTALQHAYLELKPAETMAEPGERSDPPHTAGGEAEYSRVPVLNADEDPRDADWMRQRWPWPEVTNKEELLAQLKMVGNTLEEFKQWPLYERVKDQPGMEWLKEL